MNKSLLLSLTILSSTTLANEIDPFEMSLEDILDVKIEVATLKENRENDIPATVSIMTSKEWERFGATKGGEVLDRMTGAISTPFFGNDMIGIRGFSTTGNYRKTAYVLDGISLNNYTNGSSQNGPANIQDLFLLEKIEFARGPISNIYGSSAMLGAISMKTWSPKNDTTEVMTSLGNFGYDQLGVRTSNKINKYRFNLAFTHRDYSDFNVRQQYIDGNKDLKEGTSKRAWKRQGALAKITKNDFSFQYLYSSYNFNDWPSFETNVLHDSREVSIKPSELHLVKLEDTFKLSTIKLKTTLHFQQGSTYFMNTLVGEGFPDPTDTAISYSKTRENIYGVKLNFSNSEAKNVEWFIQPEFTKHDVNLREGALGQLGTQTQTIEGEGFSRKLTSLTGNLKYSLLEKKLSFHLGGRWDSYSDGDNEFSPRLATIFHKNKKLTYKFIYSSSYRAPDLSNKIGTSNLNVQPSPDVRAEILTNYEFTTLYKTKNERYFFSIFKNKLKDEILTQRVSLSDPGPKAVNVRDGKTSGIELEGSKSYKDYNFTFGTTYIFERDALNSPKSMVNWSIGKSLNKLYLGVHGRHLFSYYSSQDFTSVVDTVRIEKMSRYFDLGFRADYSFKKLNLFHQVALNISNALDRENRLPANGTRDWGLKTPGIGYYFSYKVKL